jgi:HlyD family secretion protein
MKIEPQAVVEQNVTMFPVLVHLSNRDGLLKPGMNAEVVVEVARRDDAVTVPNAAVVSMRDAMAAGGLFGLGEDQMRAAMRAGRGGQPQLAAADPQAADQAATPAAATPRSDAAGAPAAAAQLSAECQALRERIAAGGFANASEADRAKMRECNQNSGARRDGAATGAGASAGADADRRTGPAQRRGQQQRRCRPGIVFVQTRPASSRAASCWA